MTPEKSKQAAELIRKTAELLREVEKTACVTKEANNGPVINIAKLRSLLNGSRTRTA